MSSPLDSLSADEREQAEQTSMPDWMDPMLAKLTQDHFSDPEWIFERKLDGERVVTYVNDAGDVRLMSRNEKRLNDSYPEIEEALSDQAPAGCILDGEMVAFDAENGEAFLEEACESGWEGLIAKKADSAYVHSRSSHRLKFKCVQQQEFVIGGWTEPHGERKGFGALLIGFYRDGDLVYAGKVGTGYDDETLESLHDRMTKIERETSPFDVGDVPEKEVHFVTPKLVCEVKFTEWTSDDRLRHPAYMGLRRDKDAEEVQKEAESQAVPS